MNQSNKKAADALNKASNALAKGNRSLARYWAREAATLDPQQEEPWLILAALGSPRASLAYLQRALQINPDSERARKGMHWAISRYRTHPIKQQIQRQVLSEQFSTSNLITKRPAAFPWIIITFLILVGFSFLLLRPTQSSIASSSLGSISFNGVGISKSTHTPIPTITPSPTFTPSNTPSATPSLTPTLTETPIPTNTPPPLDSENESPGVFLPDGVEKGERWIDVDLSNQRVYAYQGKNLMNTFIVSTGTWQHPTVTGQYRIYVKYTSADMAGPGYYLPNVPYVMYFYKGYGIHGTYWHNNFGTPMSHGCINLRTEDAAWIFSWSSIGTIINIRY